MADSQVLADLRRRLDALSTAPSGSPTSGSLAGGDPGVVAEPGDPEVGRAMAFLLRSTAQRPLTVGEARDKLAAREVPTEAIDAAVAKAIAAKVLDDAAFARGWVNDRGANRGYGRDRLRRELQRRKVEEDVIDGALRQLDDVDARGQAMALARERAQRMPATLPPARVAQRLVGLLVRRGHPSDLAHEVARSVTALDRGWD